MTFNFEMILQTHDQPVRAMSWSNDGHWLATGDQSGYIKYWQQNMCNCCMYQAHKDQPCRGITNHIARKHFVGFILVSYFIFLYLESFFSFLETTWSKITFKASVSHRQTLNSPRVLTTVRFEFGISTRGVRSAFCEGTDRT